MRQSGISVEPHCTNSPCPLTIPTNHAPQSATNKPPHHPARVALAPRTTPFRLSISMLMSIQEYPTPLLPASPPTQPPNTTY